MFNADHFNNDSWIRLHQFIKKEQMKPWKNTLASLLKSPDFRTEGEIITNQ